MVATDVWMDSGAMVSMIPEQRIYIGEFDGESTTNSVTTLTLGSEFTVNFALVPDLYVGCQLEIYLAADNTLKDVTTIRSNTATTVDVINALAALITDHTLYYGIIRAYGAPVPGPKNGANPRLLADNWMGLASSITIPTTSVDVKQLNVDASGTRNFIYQFKGAETTGNASLTAFANSFPWLYYALGSKTITATTTDGSNGDFEIATLPSTHDDSIFAKDGNRLIRVDQAIADSANILCPPVRAFDTTAPFLDEDYQGGTTYDLITYAISESNDTELPSFAMEYTLRKAAHLTTTAVDASKEDVYTKIYPGCVVSNLSISATAGQEIECSVDLMPKTTFVAPTNYEPGNGETDITKFINFGSRRGSIQTGSTEYTSDVMEPIMRPFFFSDGTVELFNEEFLRIESMTLAIDNGVAQRRFIGKSDKRHQIPFATQRTYSLDFTALVTNADLFDHFRQEHAFSLTGTGTTELTAPIKLRFDKTSGESLLLEFKDYHVGSAEFPLTNDQGPITVSFQVTPLALEECSLVTYWGIQG